MQRMSSSLDSKNGCGHRQDIDTGLERFWCDEEGSFPRKEVNSVHQEEAVQYPFSVCPTIVFGAECWTPLSKHARKLNTFHH